MKSTRSDRRIVSGSLLIALIALIAGPLGVRAETGSGSLLDALRQLDAGSRSSESTLPDLGGQARWSLETPVDAAVYRVLPGDGLAVGVWGEGTAQWSVRVSPEGDLMLPFAGPVHVAGLLLRDAEVRVREALRPLYPRSSCTVRLVEPGRFRISVSGMVAHPGIYEATGVDRVSLALEAAGGVRAGGSTRAIRVHSGAEGGAPAETREVDLLPWILNGDLASNPVVGPGTSIEVPPRQAAVCVRGPVRGRIGLELPEERALRIGDRPEEEPDLFVEWREGDTVASALAQVGGMSNRATGTGLLRHGDGPLRQLDLSSPRDLSTPVAAGDVLEIEYATRWVYVTGAVRFPGRYPYLPGLKALDYIGVAGGPTELGRASGWTVRNEENAARPCPPDLVIASGELLRIPERRSYRLSTFINPLSSATAIVISIIALSRR